ncbi:hypothetical protein BY996DRAFT_1146567 [Phakopsora pachyrhizi]|nr:hypothetical protein BY996DRAFT_1146567 [Phakopsora pachyrhizi]
MKLKTDKDEKTIARVECLSSSLQEFSPRVVSIVATRARPWTSSSAGKTHTKEERKTAPYLKNKQTSQPSPHKTSPKEEIKQSFISGHEKRLQKSRRRNQVRSVGVVWRRELPALQGNQSEQSKEVESEYQRAWAAVQAQEREAQGVQQLWIADQGRASQNSQIASQHNSLGTPRNVSPSPPVSNQHTSTPVTPLT